MDKNAPATQLSPRERQVLKLLINEHSTAEIAELLLISARSVEKYRSGLREKLSCSSLDELSSCAREHQLID